MISAGTAVLLTACRFAPDGYDPGSRLTHDTVGGGGTSYSYDVTDQLTTVTGSRAETYTYDSNGNRNSSGYTTTAGNRVAQASTALGTFTYAYDFEGNRTAQTNTGTGDVTTYSYDQRDRLTGFTTRNSGGTVTDQATYTYDALDRRIGVKTGVGTTYQTWTVYDGDMAYADVNGLGQLLARYLDGPAVDELLAKTDSSNNTSWYLTDRQGSVRNVASPAGSLTGTITYDSFGRELTHTGSADKFGYDGRDYDAGTKFVYDRGRYVDAVLGAFTQEDPSGFGGGDANLYRYVGNSPTNGSDPSGLSGGPAKMGKTANGCTDGLGYRGNQTAKAAREQEATDWLMTRSTDVVVGGVQYVAGSAAMALAGFVAYVDPEPWSKVQAAAAAVYAYDVSLTGFKRILGQRGNTAAGKVLRSAGSQVGLGPQTNELVADTIEMSLSVGLLPANSLSKLGPRKALPLLLEEEVIEANLQAPALANRSTSCPNSTASQQLPLQLTNQPTTHTLSQIRNMRQPAKWQAGEQYVQELYGSAGQRHFPVTGTGGRYVDAPVNLPSGGVLASEVKTYGQWRTVSGVPQQQTVPLSDHIRQQIQKDVWLRNNVPGYDPRWIFLDAPPSQDLLDCLRQTRIISVTHQ